MPKLNINEIDLKNKLVIVRCDFNIPLENGVITDDYRLIASLKTISYLQKKMARVVLLSHLGRPDGKIVESLRLSIVAHRLEKLIKTNLHYARDTIGPEAKKIISELKPGQIALLENLRFHKEESKNDNKFARQLTHGADYFVNDCFGMVHREHASSLGITKYLPSCMGFLMQAEIASISKIIPPPKKGFLTICGGGKLADKTTLIKSLLDLANQIIIGGAMSFPFLKAQGYETGPFPIEKKQIKIAEKILTKLNNKKTQAIGMSNQSPDSIVLPVDFACSSIFDFEKRKIGKLEIYPYNKIPRNFYPLDIGPKTVLNFQQLLEKAKVVFWNGPMGVYELEETAKGTLAIAKALGAKPNIFSIVGGGDSIVALRKLGIEKSISHISTGGGATLSFINNQHLATIEALK